jgi:hypothetical protein
MKDFDNLNDVFIPMVERDYEDFMMSGGAWSPEVAIINTTRECANQWISKTSGRFGCGYILKLKEIDHEEIVSDEAIFIVTEFGLREGNGSPIVCERIGSNIDKVFCYIDCGMKCTYGRVKLMTVDSFEKVEID